jgi:hypothetical protein
MMGWFRTGLTGLLMLAVGAIAAAQVSDADMLHFEHADLLRVTADNKVVATGNVKVTYREYSVTSGKAISDPDTNIVTFEQDVVLSTQGIQVHGESLSLNLKTHQWDLKSAKSTLTPEVLKGNATAPVFISGKDVSGVKTNEVGVKSGSFTTCDLAEPHYVLAARQVDIYPERKMIARHVTLLALGHRLFSLPVLSIPLNRVGGRSNLIPQVGQTQAEGMFVKTAYNYLATKNSNGLLKLDLMSRKGFGQGVEQSYTLGKGAGSIQAYHLFDRTLGADSITGRLTHRQNFGPVVMNVASDYRSNSYQYAPATKTNNTDFSLLRNLKGMNTELRVRRSFTNGIGTFETLNSVLTHRQKLLGANTALTLDFSDFGSSSSTSDNLELNSKLEMSRQLHRYDWQFVFSKRYDLDGSDFLGDERFASLDRLPELTLQSDTSRLGRSLPFGLPATMALSVGRYNEGPLGVDTERMMFDINTRPQQHKISSALGLNYGLGFRQAFYGNEAAQYVIRADTSLTQKLGGKSNFTLRYRYQRPRGASAFRFDFANTYNVLGGRLDLRETEKFKLSLTSGYNFALPQLPWQDVALRARYTPSKVFSIYTSTGYDLNHSQWRSLINQFQIRAPGGLSLDLGTRYDIERSELGTARAVLETPFGAKTKIKAVAGYNGFSGAFDYRALQVTRDLHCWEATLAFVDQADFFAEKGVRLNLRIKAFPIFDQFGVGQRGQSLTDTSMGDVL